jgi:hypothetical protein
MTPFTEWIKVNNCPTEFSFRRIQAPLHDKFFILMVDPQGMDNISFDMTRSPQGEWNIVRPIPDYIGFLKEQLVKIIEKHCQLIAIPFYLGAKRT